MKLETSFPPEAIIGQPVTVTARVSIDAPQAMAFAGIKLSAVRPCDKPLVIEQREVFCKGTFNPAEYERSLAVALPPRLVPSSASRGIRYKITLYARVPVDADPNNTQEYFDEGTITLVDVPRKDKMLDANPVVLSIKGLKLSLQKDVYRPGETIKVTFETAGLRELKILLMQRSNILCNCTQFGRVCTQVPKIPPSAAGAARASNPATGFLLLPVPRSAELTARHDWEPKDKSSWSDKFGDYNEWYLSVLGIKYSGEEIHYEIPVEIDEGRIATEKHPGADFFDTSIAASSIEGGTVRPAFQARKISVREATRGPGGLVFTVKNETKDVLKGTTCKVTGIKDMFFESAPFMIGIGDVDAGEEITLRDITIPAGVSDFTLEFDSNQGKAGQVKITT